MTLRFHMQPWMAARATVILGQSLGYHIDYPMSKMLRKLLAKDSALASVSNMAPAHLTLQQRLVDEVSAASSLYTSEHDPRGLEFSN